jgi:hypothetical protein
MLLSRGMWEGRELTAIKCVLDAVHASLFFGHDINNCQGKNCLFLSYIPFCLLMLGSGAQRVNRGTVVSRDFR